MFTARVTSRLVRPSRGNPGPTNIRCDWSRQVLDAWLANEGKGEREKDMFVMGTVEEVVLSAIIRGVFDL